MARVLTMPGTPAAVPTLDELAADPARVTGLPPAALHGLLCRCLTLQTALMSALLTTAAHTNIEATSTPAPDTLLNVTEAARRLATSTDWLYRHADRLPFTVRNGRQLRFSGHGIERYIRERRRGPY